MSNLILLVLLTKIPWLLAYRSHWAKHVPCKIHIFKHRILWCSMVFADEISILLSSLWTFPYRLLCNYIRSVCISWFLRFIFVLWCNITLSTIDLFLWKEPLGMEQFLNNSLLLFVGLMLPLHSSCSALCNEIMLL